MGHNPHLAHQSAANCTRASRARRGVTLIELLITIAIIALLVSILLPALSASRHAARDLECRSRLRSACQSFVLFADDSGAGTRGDSDLDPDGFQLEDFQESLYEIAEFWKGPVIDLLPVSGGGAQLACPASGRELLRRGRIPCSAGAIVPVQNVSIGFNRRLQVRTRFVNNIPVPATAHLTSQILQLPDVPLLLDVDGEAAIAMGAMPYYTAPPVLTDPFVDIYESGQFWFPGGRHRGRLNVGFVGGHVLSSAHPTAEPWWRWEYQPRF